MTVFALIETLSEDFWRDFCDEVSVIEGVEVSIVSSYVAGECLNSQEALTHIMTKTSPGDAIHVKALFSLGRSIRDVIATIEAFNELDVRVVISELDGAEFYKNEPRNLIDILNRFSFEARQ